MPVQPVAERPDQGDNNEQTPQSVHYAGYGREQLNQVLQQPLEALGKRPPEGVKLQMHFAQELEDSLAQVTLAEKDRCCDAEERSKKQRQ
jgi:hypothetical protein